MSEKEKQNRGSQALVPMERIFCNSWNYNQQDPWLFEKQVTSLREFALSAPIVVREVPFEDGTTTGQENNSNSPQGSPRNGSPQSASPGGSPGKLSAFEIIDGEHRYRAAQELGFDEIAVWNLGQVSDQEAQQLTIILNEVKGRPNVDDLAHLLASLDDSVGREQLDTVMPFTPQQIDDLIETLDFDWSNFEADDDDPIDEEERIQMVRMEFRVDEKQAQLIRRAFTTYQAYDRPDPELTQQEADNEALLGIAKHFLESMNSD